MSDQLKGLEPIRLKGAPKVSEKWSGTLNDLRVEKKLGWGSYATVWVSRNKSCPVVFQLLVSGNTRLTAVFSLTFFNFISLYRDGLYLL